MAKRTNQAVTIYRVRGTATTRTGERRRLSGATWTATGEGYVARQRVCAEAERRGLTIEELEMLSVSEWPSNLPSGRTLCLRTRRAR